MAVNWLLSGHSRPSKPYVSKSCTPDSSPIHPRFTPNQCQDNDGNGAPACCISNRHIPPTVTRMPSDFAMIACSFEYLGVCYKPPYIVCNICALAILSETPASVAQDIDIETPSPTTSFKCCPRMLHCLFPHHTSPIKSPRGTQRGQIKLSCQIEGALKRAWQTPELFGTAAFDCGSAIQELVSSCLTDAFCLQAAIAVGYLTYLVQAIPLLHQQAIIAHRDSRGKPDEPS